ncbi:ATP-binding protein [Leptolyngbya sp. Cla-17]|uniref:hybrid sensor histidine kinase/response regulator n=1 Tax=Leptolyngbya sp. Cla-17 TaxID=2803751 RepID=UPI0018D656B8|nr:ATP-binding protein [Leptolyngbya sp. Cla-17]
MTTLKGATNPHLPTPLVTAASEQTITVLLVDDQATVNEAIHCMLETEANLTYHYCSRAEKALQIATEIAPTVILQDLILPDSDGMTMVKKFRANPVTCDVPIIMLSTNDNPQTKAEAFAIGVNDYLVKLPNQIELVARIRYHSQAYLNRQAHTAALLAQAHAKELEQTLQELRQTQAQLIQTEKLSSLGQMLAGVAHEINNPVNFIFGNLTYIDTYVQDLMKLVQLYQDKHPEPDSAIQAHLEDIDYDFVMDDLLKMLRSTRMGAERIVQIVLSLRNFSRQDHQEMKPSNIHEGIDSTLLILSHRLKLGINVVKDYGDLPLVDCYPAQLNQVLMNIINNAIDALLDQPNQQKKEIIIHTSKINKNHIKIQIKDNGPGIPLAVQTKLFEPFFTTKPVDKGTGLGLSICQQIIANHQGTIQVISKPDEGAEFTIQLAVQSTVA